MGDYGIKVSEPGQDVLTCADRYLTLKSDYTLLKIALSGTISCASGGWTEISHNLGYKPQYLAYVDVAGVVYKVFFTFSSPFEAPPFLSRIDTTKLYIYNNSGTTRDVYYYIFYEAM